MSDLLFAVNIYGIGFLSFIGIRCLDIARDPSNAPGGGLVAVFGVAALWPLIAVMFLFGLVISL